MGPYINNGNYVYGTAQFHQPSMPKYDCIPHHMGSDYVGFPMDKIRDDGVPYRHFKEPKCCENCTKCNKVNRDAVITNLANIESSIDKVLTITLYGAKKDLDKTIKMRIGNKYCVTYLTERGLTTVTGIFKELSENVPDKCTKYIGNYTSVTSSACIGLDCSTSGSSDKRLIYIASIRYIEEIFEEGDDPYGDLTQDEKLRKMLIDISLTLNGIEEYLKSKEEENPDPTPTPDPGPDPTPTPDPDPGSDSGNVWEPIS